MKDLLKQEIINDLEAYLQESIFSQFTENQSTFSDMISYHMGVGKYKTNHKLGKRIRPYLMLLILANCGGDWSNGLPAAAAIELIHNFSLVHDDIQDRSPERHARPTVWTKYGEAQAINAGDGLFNLAFDLLSQLKSNFSCKTVLLVQEILHKAVHDLINGQVMDLEFEKREEVSEAEYFEMIKGKTSALLSASTQVGSLLGQCDKNLITEADKFGVNLGLAFQILDDIIGIWGDPEITGKPIYSDILNRKKSLPIIFGLQQIPEFNQKWKSKVFSSDNIPIMANLLLSSGAKDYCQTMAENFTNTSLQSLQKLKFGDSIYWQMINDLTLELLSRDK